MPSFFIQVFALRLWAVPLYPRSHVGAKMAVCGLSKDVPLEGDHRVVRVYPF